MITLARSAHIAANKNQEATEFAVSICKYLNDKYGLNVAAHTPVAGDMTRILWTSSYPSLAALETTRGKMMADPHYLELLAKAGEFFVAGSPHDELWRSL